MSLVQTFSRLRLVTADTLPLRAPAACEFPLARGQVHEFSNASGQPPLTVMLGLAGRVLPPRQRLLFLGRACWPTFQVLCAMLGDADDYRQSKIENWGGGKSKMALARCLFLDPPSPRERFWALAEALRCPAIGAVIADGEGLDATASRRLQLAAEVRGETERGALAFLARPDHAHAQPSWAATRWQVRPWRNDAAPAPGVGRTGNEPLPTAPPLALPLDSLSTRMSWELSLTSSRHGGGAGSDAPRRWIFSWTYQVFRGTGALDLSAAVGHSTAHTPVAQTA